MGTHLAPWKSRIVGYEDVPPDQLIPSDLNFRRHPKNQQDALQGLIDQIGYLDPVIVQKSSGRVIDGHLRVEQAIRQNQPTIPVQWVDLTDDEANLALASIDPVSAMAFHDQEQLDALLAMVETDNADVQALLDSLAGETEIVDGLSDPDSVPGVPDEPITKPGDIWLLGRHRLMCGDATNPLDVDELMNGESAACVFTSPPYAVGVDYGETYQDTIDELRSLLGICAPLWLRILEPGGYAVTNFGDIASGRNIAGTDEPCEYPMALEYWPIFRACGYSLWSRRIWCKPNARVHSMQVIASNRAATDWEHVWTWKAPGKSRMERVGGLSQMGWFDSTSEEGVNVGKETHGAGMATVVAQRGIEVHSNPGEIVHEPFCGTGTTMIAAEQLGRTCYGMEISPAYCDVIVKRYETFTGKTAVLAHDRAMAG